MTFFHRARACRYYGIDRGASEPNGKPCYKRMQGDGGFLKAGEVGAGSQCLMWDSEDESWQFRNFGGPDGDDYPYKNKSDTPEPPPSGWVQYESCGTGPYPTVTFLDEDAQDRSVASHESALEKVKESPRNPIFIVEGAAYDLEGTSVNG